MVSFARRSLGVKTSEVFVHRRSAVSFSSLKSLGVRTSECRFLRYLSSAVVLRDPLDTRYTLHCGRVELGAERRVVSRRAPLILAIGSFFSVSSPTIVRSVDFFRFLTFRLLSERRILLRFSRTAVGVVGPSSERHIHHYHYTHDYKLSILTPCPLADEQPISSPEEDRSITPSGV